MNSRLTIAAAAVFLSTRVFSATLHFAGDSTLDEYGGHCERFPYASWGSQLGEHMLSCNKVRNLACSGASSSSFLKSGRWQKLIDGVAAGDFVLIQFGHNDQKRSNDFYRKERWTDPRTTFREIVRNWVKEIRAKGATPILASPICRCTFDKAGKKLVDTEHKSDGICLRSYRDAMSELSKELGCDYVDMNELTRNYLESIGREEALKCFVISTGIVRGKDGEPARDTTHPIKTGAMAFAKLFLDNVTVRGLSVAKLFARGDFPITEFGARPDGSKCTDAFARAFAAAEAAGGGRIVVPAGKWASGAIRFRSNCELHLAEGSRIVFSQDPADYLPAVHTSWEGMECVNYCPLVFAYCCTNVAITGKGELCGFEGDFKDTAWYPWVPQENGIRTARLQLYNWGATDYPVMQREIWKMPKANTRPHLLQFNRCVGVRWQDFKVRNSPFWTTHLYLCADVSVRGIDVYAHGNNNDGIDIEMSRNVVVEKCRFDQGDDGVVIKSGRNRDAWRLATPTKNVLVRDCEIVNGHTMLGIGSEISGGVSNVRMQDCIGHSVYRAVFIKTNHRRGAVLEKISADRIRIDEALEAVFAIGTDVLYEWKSFPDYETKLTTIRDVDVRNITCGQAKRRIRIEGDARLPVENVRLDNLSCAATEQPDIVVNAKSVVIDGKAQ